MAAPKAPKLFSLTPTPSQAWHAAIERWGEGDCSKVRRCLTDGRPIPKFAREWLADALEGKKPRKRGPKSKDSRPVAEGLADMYRRMKIVERYNWVLAIERLRDLASEKHGRRDGAPMSRALAIVAEEFGLQDGDAAISHIVYPRKRKARNSAK